MYNDNLIARIFFSAVLVFWNSNLLPMDVSYSDTSLEALAQEIIKYIHEHGVDTSPRSPLHKIKAVEENLGSDDTRVNSLKRTILNGSVQEVQSLELGSSHLWFQDPFKSLTYLKNGFFALNNDGDIHIIHGPLDQPFKKIRKLTNSLTDGRGTVHSVVSIDHQKLAFCSEPGDECEPTQTIEIWNWNNGKRTNTFTREGQVGENALCNLGPQLIVLCRKIREWNRDFFSVLPPTCGFNKVGESCSNLAATVSLSHKVIKLSCGYFATAECCTNPNDYDLTIIITDSVFSDNYRFIQRPLELRKQPKLKSLVEVGQDRIAICTSDLIRIWDWKKNIIEWTFDFCHAAVAYCDDGFLALMGFNGVIRILDINQKICVAEINARDDHRHEGHLVYCGYGSLVSARCGRMSRWNLANLQLLLHFFKDLSFLHEK